MDENDESLVFVTFWDCRRHVPMTSSVERTDLDFKISVALHPPIVHMCTKFQPSRPHSSWEKCDENFNTWILEKEKKIKGMNKQQQPDSGIHHTSTHCPRVYQVPTF